MCCWSSYARWTDLKANAELAEKIIYEVSNKVNEVRPKSNSHQALKYALLTNKEFIPDETLKKISLLTKKYLWFYR